MFKLRVTPDLFSAAFQTFMVPKKYQLATLDMNAETLLCLRFKSPLFLSCFIKIWALLFTNIKSPNIIFCRNLFGNSRTTCENRDGPNDHDGVEKRIFCSILV